MAEQYAFGVDGVCVIVDAKGVVDCSELYVVGASAGDVVDVIVSGTLCESVVLPESLKIPASVFEPCGVFDAAAAPYSCLEFRTTPGTATGVRVKWGPSQGPRAEPFTALICGGRKRLLYADGIAVPQ